MKTKRKAKATARKRTTRDNLLAQGLRDMAKGYGILAGRYIVAVEKIAEALYYPIEVERCKRANEAIAAQEARAFASARPINEVQAESERMCREDMARAASADEITDADYEVKS